jgi:cyclopropane-fatty-acyl-phospholipid synthase
MTGELFGIALRAAERGWLPDPFIRLGIRRLCSQRLASEEKRQSASSAFDELVGQMGTGPIARATAEANQQHYAQPPELFVQTLGPRLKYSCCFWPEGISSLAEAEAAALGLTCDRARIVDGMDILELGCGWGSLTLWMATEYPNSRITAVSNSAAQGHHIAALARGQGLQNIRLITADMNSFDIPERFDRVISVEMFEHMHNYRALLRSVSGWLKPNGLAFVHVFAHRRYAYKYETSGARNWMARNFFTGGVMPSRELLTRFQEDVRLVESWWWNGRHYSRTAEAWLENMRRNRDGLIRTLAGIYGVREAPIWYQRWRMFYLACQELWGYRRGEEWGVAHYLFEPRRRKGRQPPPSPEGQAA